MGQALGRGEERQEGQLLVCSEVGESGAGGFDGLGPRTQALLMCMSARKHRIVALHGRPIGMADQSRGAAVKRQ